MNQNHITHAPGTPGTLQGFLNWDHCLHPTPLEDLLCSIHFEVARHTGFKMLSVSVVNDALRIESQSGTLLVIDLTAGREIYGRVTHVGFTYMEMDILRQFIKQALSLYH